MSFSSVRSAVPLAFFLAAVVSSPSAYAQVVNGSFESGASENATTITGWDTVGNAFLSSTTRFSTPANGTYQATLATTLDGQFGERAGSGTSAAVAETFLGISSGALQGVGNGRVSRVSAIRQTINLSAGDTLFFSYNFLTDEVYKATDPGLSVFDTRPDASRNDFGFLSVSTQGTSTVVKLIDTFYNYTSTGPGQSDFTTGLVPTPDTDPLFSESGYLTSSFTVSTTGVYTFGFGIVDGERGTVGTSGSPSGFLIDNVRVQAAPVTPTAVPEPSEWAITGMLGTSMCGLMVRARRKAATTGKKARASA